MVDSTWGDWFVREEVEAADPEGLSIWYLGCNGWILRSPEATLYVDPYFAGGDPPYLFRAIPVPVDPAAATACDGVLVTHEHIDHFHPPSFDPLVENCDATVYAPEASFEQSDYGVGKFNDSGPVDVPGENSERIAAGESFQVGDLTVHVRGSHDPDAEEPVTFVVEHESGTFFNAGDSRPTETFVDLADEFDLDVGTLAFGSRGYQVLPDEGATETEWYMGLDDVIRAANQLELDRLLPCHWDMWKNVETDPKVLHDHAASYEYPRVIDVVTVGDRVRVDEPGIVPWQAQSPPG